MTKKWIPNDLEEGALHRMLGLSEDKKIPMNLLEKILAASIGDKIKLPWGKTITVTSLLKKRANLARTFKRINK